MKIRIVFFATGLLLGIGTTLFLQKVTANDNARYIRLKKSYRIGDVGSLNEGTILKIDRGMPEGFTRYLLYLNLRSDEVDVYNPEHKNEIIPYWLMPDTTK